MRIICIVVSVLGSHLILAIPCMAAGNLVVDGDSIAVGQGADQRHTLALQIAEILKPDRIKVVGKSGRPVSECLQMFYQNIAPQYDASVQPNVIFFHAGDNDIRLGSDGDAAYAQFSQYVRQAHSQGWLVVTSTELPRYDMPPEKQAFVNRYNNLVRNNSADADAIADFAADPIMSGRISRYDRHLYTADGIHPTNEGYSILAQIAASKLFPFFSAKR